MEGPGLIDCHLYEQPGRLVLHLVNLTSAGTWRAPVEELIAVGPIKVKIKLPKGVGGRAARLLVAGGSRQVSVNEGVAALEITSIRTTKLLFLVELPRAHTAARAANLNQAVFFAVAILFNTLRKSWPARVESFNAAIP